METDVTSIRDSMANLDDLVSGVRKKLDAAKDKTLEFSASVEDRDRDIEKDIGDLFDTYDGISAKIVEAQDTAEQFAKKVPDDESFGVYERQIAEIKEDIGLEMDSVKDLADDIKVKLVQFENQLSKKEEQVEGLTVPEGELDSLRNRLTRLDNQKLETGKAIEGLETRMRSIMGETDGYKSVLENLQDNVKRFFQRGDKIHSHLDKLDKKYVQIETKINQFAKSYADLQEDIDQLEKKLKKKVKINRLTIGYGALATLFSGLLAYLMWMPK